MASSRVVLSSFGSSAIGGSLITLVIGILTLNLLLLIVPVAVLALVATELLLFDRGTRDFGPEWFRWQRFENSSEVRIDGVGSMAIDLRRVRGRSFYAEVFDPQPDTFEVSAGSPRLLTWWPADAPIRLAYVYRPRARGNFRVGPTVVVAHDPFGFGFRMAKLENRWEVLVTPALSVEEASAASAFGSRGPSEVYRRRAGPGSELRSLREYLPSDDARKIAWRRSAIDKLYVREHEEEAHPELLILLDASRDMRLGVPGAEGFEQAIEGATVIAGQAIRRTDRVSLLVFSDRLIAYVPPQRGHAGAEALTQSFARLALSPHPFDLPGAVAAALERLRSPTTIVLFSTVLSLSGPVETAVGELRSRDHRLIVLCPDVTTLFPPASDPVAVQTMGLAIAPVQQQVAQAMERLRGAGALVIPYPAPQIREVAAELHAWMRPGAGSG